MGPSIDSLADRVATVLQRRADGPGAVDAEEAESAVTAASSSSGAPLRSDVRERFESSLGADLSAVRVHTGDESAAAAKSVGAHAYATGNDIHFASGKYQPDDPFGLHLLAHEVAHTVQQSGGSAPTRQNKLEVSSPGDTAEVEADRAADAMIRGEPAAVTGASGVARRTLYRVTDLEKAANEGADAGAKKPIVGQVLSLSIVGDRQSAMEALRVASWATHTLERAREVGDASPDDIVHNHGIEDGLRDYVMAADGHTSAIDGFALQFVGLQADFGRLTGMAQQWGFNLAAAKTPEDAHQTAEQQVQTASGSSVQDLHAKVAALAAKDPVLARELEGVKTDEEKVTNAGETAAAAQTDLTGAVNALAAPAQALAAARSDATSAEDQKAALKLENDERAFYEMKKDMAGAIGKAAVTLVAKSPKDAGIDLLKDGVATIMKNAVYPKIDGTGKAIRQLQSSAAAFQSEGARRKALSACNALLDANSAVRTKAEKLAIAASALETAKSGHKNRLKAMGAKLDAAAKKGGGTGTAGDDVKFQNITTFLSEADAFLAQATTVLRIGKQNLQLSGDRPHGEKTAAERAREKWYEAKGKTLFYAQELEGSSNAAGAGKQHFAKREMSFSLGGGTAQTAHDQTGSQGPVAGTNTKLDEIIRNVEDWSAKITAYRDTFRRVLTS